MNLKELIRRALLSFFIICSGATLSLFFYMHIFNMSELSIDHVSALLLIVVLTNLTHIVLYSRKKLSREKLYFRYVIVSVLVSIIVVLVAVDKEWASLSDHIMIVALLISAVLITMAVLTLPSHYLKMENVAHIDVLTMAYSRRYFMKTAARALERCIKADREFALITMDLDHFKAVNDTYGHIVGDEVLKISVARISHILEKGTLLARIGGEEFVVMITDMKKDDVINIAWRMQRSLAATPFSVGDLSIGVTASFGIANKSDSANLDEILSNSDKALYEAKANGRNTVAF
jgi:diguanylate cyclase (GGDEF)-like protein